MKTLRHFSIALLLLLLLTAVPTAFAHNNPKAGDVISGKVYNNDGPIMKAIVMELDTANRAAAFNFTDEYGRFVFFLVNPENRIRVAIPGKEDYVPITVPIDTTYFEFKMNKKME